MARVSRKLNRLDEAGAACTEAGELARVAGDRYSSLISRSGRANTMLGRGNLADAERRLDGIFADARAAGEPDIEARAEHDIAAVLYRMGHSAEAIPRAWHAVELFQDEDSPLRALTDVGIMLLG